MARKKGSSASGSPPQSPVQTRARTRRAGLDGDESVVKHYTRIKGPQGKGDIQVRKKKPVN